MKFAPEILVARRYITGKRGGSRYLMGAVLGIALSLVPIIVTLLVADGMIRGIVDRFLELGTGHIQIWDSLQRGGDESGGFNSVKETALENQSVRGAWQEIQGMGLILGFKGRTGVIVRAVESGFWEDSGTQNYLSLIEGEARIDSDTDVLLGKPLAEAAGVKIGDTVRLMTVRESADGRSIPRTSIFKVKGIVSAGYHEIDSQWCLISYAAGKKILESSVNYSYLVVKIKSPYKNADETALELLSALSFDYGVYTWRELLESQYRSYESTRQLLLFIMALIVIIAAVNVSSATSMLIIERYRDIAILKASGASPLKVSGVFILAGFLTGLLGTAIGVGVGLLVGRFINGLIHALEGILNAVQGFFTGGAGGSVKILDPDFYLENIPIVINWGTIAFIAGSAIVCSVIAAAIPAFKAGGQKPIKLLRKI